jgi:hypothetical protein
MPHLLKKYEKPNILKAQKISSKSLWSSLLELLIKKIIFLFSTNMVFSILVFGVFIEDIEKYISRVVKDIRRASSYEKPHFIKSSALT